MGIYLCGEAKEQTKRHPEERSDVGIYLCEDAKEQRKIGPRNDDKSPEGVIPSIARNLLRADRRQRETKSN